MVLSIFGYGEQFLVQTVGSMWLAGIIIVILFMVLCIWRGLDFRYALILFAPAIIRMCQAGWFLSWIEGLLWIIVVGFGFYMVWSYIANRT